MLPFRLLTLSLAIHLFFHFVALQIPPLTPYESSPAIDIEYIEAEPQREGRRQVVRETEQNDDKSLEKLKEKVRFLSKTAKRVQKEMQARKTGKTKNRAQKVAKNPPPTKPRAPVSGQKPSSRSSSPAPSTRAFDIAKEIQMTPSTVGEQLPSDIDFGEITSLNTERFTYYSFFSRVEDLFRFRWESNLRKATALLSQRPLRGKYRNRWKTELKITLDNEGKFVRYELVKSSGLELIDLAAAKAFVDAEFFPNPPADLVVDGEIELHYQFVLRWKPPLWTQR